VFQTTDLIEDYPRIACGRGRRVRRLCERDRPQADAAASSRYGTADSLVLYLIIDLDRLNSGFIINNQQAMLDAAESIKGFAD